jgi:starch-binding outer membrane protein, SusD/RagB family
MKTIKYWTIILLLPLCFSSCMDVIDKPSVSTISDDMWNNYEISQMYLDNLYVNSLPSIGMLDNCNQTDEAYGNSATYFLYGAATVGTDNSYSTGFWHRIRYINLMIGEMTRLSTLSQAEQNQLLGQARFLRAIEYWQIVRLYGGIPIQTKAIDVNVDEDDIPRSSTKACVDFIISDLDFAASALPADWTANDPSRTNYGRLTSLAAKAYKGRVLLHFASPMFTERDAYTSNDNTEIAAFSISDSSKTARWDSAYTANKVAYEQLIANGYALNPSFSATFTTEAYLNSEAVMVRLYTGGTNYRHSLESVIRPSSLNGTGYNVNPCWELVKAFPTIDGKNIYAVGSSYQDKYYWLDRDPRFYNTLVYNGMIWDISTTTGRKQWCYVGTNSEPTLTYSGFYCRKGQDITLTADQLNNGKTDWMEIRLAEVMLNLAEAANETNRTDEAVTMIRLIRQRAGILQGADPNTEYGVSNSLSKTDMLDLIMKERFIEMAFENQRYWDLRRRMMYTRDLNATTLKLNGTRRKGLIVAPLSTAKRTYLNASKDTMTLNTSNYYQYFVPFLLRSMDNNTNIASLGINYRPDYYFVPLPAAMFLNSDLLLQTLGWSAGTFDPLVE